MPSKRRSPLVVLDITQELIDDAIPRDSSHCMIAEAVKVAYPSARSISVDLQTIRFSDPDKGVRYTYLTPRVAQVHIVNYDQGHQPDPFSVQLRNAQVTKRASRAKKIETTGPDAASKEAPKAAPDRARLVRPTSGDGVPDRIGGRTPPVPSFAKRRAFGIRALTL